METSRMTLRQIDATDAEFILALYNSPKFIEYIADRKIRTPEDAERYIREKMQPGPESYVLVNYVMIRKEDGVKLGSCGLFERQGLEGVDIGFALLPQFEGQGFALEAALQVRDAAFEDYGLKEIIAITDQRNFASQQLLEKLGMILDGPTKLPDDDTPLYLYRLRKNQWRQR